MHAAATICSPHLCLRPGAGRISRKTPWPAAATGTKTNVFNYSILTSRASSSASRIKSITPLHLVRRDFTTRWVRPHLIGNSTSLLLRHYSTEGLSGVPGSAQELDGNHHVANDHQSADGKVEEPQASDGPTSSFYGKVEQPHASDEPTPSFFATPQHVENFDASLATLSRITGYTFNDPDYAKAALWSGYTTNLDGAEISKLQSQLAMMGDSLLKTAFYLSFFPSPQPARLHSLFQVIASNTHLSNVAIRTGLGELLAPKPLTRASHAGGTLVEAVLGAIFLDSNCDIYKVAGAISSMGLFDTEGGGVEGGSTKADKSDVVHGRQRRLERQRNAIAQRSTASSKVDRTSGGKNSSHPLHFHADRMRAVRADVKLAISRLTRDTSDAEASSETAETYMRLLKLREELRRDLYEFYVNKLGTADFQPFTSDNIGIMDCLSARINWQVQANLPLSVTLEKHIPGSVINEPQLKELFSQIEVSVLSHVETPNDEVRGNPEFRWHVAAKIRGELLEELKKLVATGGFDASKYSKLLPKLEAKIRVATYALENGGNSEQNATDAEGSSKIPQDDVAIARDPRHEQRRELVLRQLAQYYDFDFDKAQRVTGTVDDKISEDPDNTSQSLMEPQLVPITVLRTAYLERLIETGFVDPSRVDEWLSASLSGMYPAKRSIASSVAESTSVSGRSISGSGVADAIQPLQEAGQYNMTAQTRSPFPDIESRRNQIQRLLAQRYGLNLETVMKATTHIGNTKFGLNSGNYASRSSAIRLVRKRMLRRLIETGLLDEHKVRQSRFPSQERRNSAEKQVRLQRLSSDSPPSSAQQEGNWSTVASTNSPSLRSNGTQHDQKKVSSTSLTHYHAYGTSNIGGTSHVEETHRQELPELRKISSSPAGKQPSESSDETDRRRQEIVELGERVLRILVDRYQLDWNEARRVIEESGLFSALQSRLSNGVTKGGFNANPSQKRRLRKTFLRELIRSGVLDVKKVKETFYAESDAARKGREWSLLMLDAAQTPKEGPSGEIDVPRREEEIRMMSSPHVEQRPEASEDLGTRPHTLGANESTHSWDEQSDKIIHDVLHDVVERYNLDAQKVAEAIQGQFTGHWRGIFRVHYHPATSEQVRERSRLLLRKALVRHLVGKGILNREKVVELGQYFTNGKMSLRERKIVEHVFRAKNRDFIMYNV